MLNVKVTPTAPGRARSVLLMTGDDQLVAVMNTHDVGVDGAIEIAMDLIEAREKLAAANEEIRRLRRFA